MTKVSDLFDVDYGHSLELNRLTRVDDGVNFVSRTAKNNGVSAQVQRIDDLEPAPAGTLTVALGGAVLETFLQPQPYYCGRDVSILTPKDPMTDPEKTWWALCIRENRYRYSYGRQANRTLGRLELPNVPPEYVQSATVPDFSYASRAAGPSIPLTDLGDWAPFRIGDLFTVRRGDHQRRKMPSQRHLPPVPLVTSTSLNNGIGGMVQAQPNMPAGSLTVAVDGSIGETFYQAVPFCATGHVAVLQSRQHRLTSAQSLFLAPLIKRNAFRYNFGRAWRQDLLRETTIPLPVDEARQISWDAIERFVAGLAFSSAI